MVFADAAADHVRVRRGFYGARDTPTIYKLSAFSWIESYQKYAATMPTTCAAVNARLDSRLAKYGYSLLSLQTHVV